MKGKVADFCDKSMIAALYIARFGLQLLRVLISFFVLTVLVIFTPLLLVADKLAEVCACPRCGGGRIAFGLQAVADFISAILGPMTEAYEWAND
ncbi:hypothetical protein, partial [Candidatus Tokpelaia sp.]|uniref:hypothetical protein n=1 Tax=Candidatus Tokpelaia sp. TaxID=2233777 RepID=UPI00123BA3D2